jgi:hypothetical protein
MNPKFHFRVLGSWLRFEFDTFNFSDSNAGTRPASTYDPCHVERDFVLRLLSLCKWACLQRPASSRNSLQRKFAGFAGLLAANPLAAAAH